MRELNYSYTHAKLRQKWVITFMYRPLYLRRKTPLYQLNRRLGGLKRRSARNALTLAGNGAPILLFISPGLSSSKNYKWLFGCIWGYIWYIGRTVVNTHFFLNIPFVNKHTIYYAQHSYTLVTSFHQSVRLLSGYTIVQNCVLQDCILNIFID